MIVSACFAGFASPFAQIDEELVNDLTVEYARGYITRFVEVYAERLEKLAPGGIDLLKRWSCSDLSFQSVWHSSFGEITKLLCRQVQSTSLDLRTGRLLLRIVEAGLPGEFTLRLGRPARFHFANWLLPTSTALRLTSDGRLCNIELDFAQKSELVSFKANEKGCWTCGRAPCKPLDSVSIGDQDVLLITLTAAEGLQYDSFGHPAIKSLALSRTLSKAANLIARASPEYHLWTKRVLRQIIPLVWHGGRIYSGSDAAQPGLIHMSCIRQPIIGAEILVHEASHQYMHILCRLGPVDDGSDTNEYYSPVKSTTRPLSAIVTAFHAFANVVMFYRLLLKLNAESDYDISYSNTQISDLIPQLEVLAAPLRGNNALTPWGKGLVEPLLESFYG
jgi:hypothetical protein